MELISRNIFLDTQYFITKSLDFNNSEFQSLQDLAQKNLVNVFLVDITDQEILKKIKDCVELSYSKLGHTDVRFLKTIPLFRQFINVYTPEKALNHFKENYNAFKKLSKVEIISSDAVTVKDIYREYCDGKAPFNSDVKKDRKREFPDAFILSTIYKWAVQAGKTTYLLSGDSDWKLYCTRTALRDFGEPDKYWLNLIESLSQFCDTILRAENRLEDTTSFADALIEQHLPKIKKECVKILQKSPIRDFSEDFYFDHEVEISGHYIMGIELDSKQLLSVSREKATYTLLFNIDLIVKRYYRSYRDVVGEGNRTERMTTGFTTFERSLNKQEFALEIVYEDGLEGNFKILSLESTDIIWTDVGEGTEFDPEKAVVTLPVVVCGVSKGAITSDGSGVEHFKNFSEAHKVYPELSIYRQSKKFTWALGNRISEELRFETAQVFALNNE